MSIAGVSDQEVTLESLEFWLPQPDKHDEVCTNGELHGGMKEDQSQDLRKDYQKEQIKKIP